MSVLPDLTWKAGFEIELVAPRGATRADLARAIAAGAGGDVRVYFHPQSEPSKVPGQAVFHNLTQGFEARGADGGALAWCVDDLTLQDDLIRTARPLPGWFRIVSDDIRMLRLVARLGRADAGIDEALEPVAALFGTEPEPGPDGMVRVVEETGMPVAIGARLPGERERPCELVTAPLDRGHGAVLRSFVGMARELGFEVPAEAAVHVHVDGAALSDARVFRDLVWLLHGCGAALRGLVATNPRCRRLAPWPDALLETVGAPDFAALPWEAARARLSPLGLTKYCDHNVRNLVHRIPGKHTFEARVFPGSIDAEEILAFGLLTEAIARRAVQGDVPRRVDTPDALLDALPLDAATRAWWRGR